MSQQVTFSIPESAVAELATASSWPRDCPTGWAAIGEGRRLKAGRGYSRRVTMTVQDATDLADYLWDAAGASAAAARDGGGDRGGWQRRLLARVEAVIQAGEPS